MEQRLWTVKDVMAMIPLGKTYCIEIIKSLPHVTMGRKLMIEPKYIDQWVKAHTRKGEEKAVSVAPKRKSRKAMQDNGLTPDGFIPYRTA